VQVWYNPEGYHSLPAYLNSLNNFILRANLPKNETSRYGKCPFTEQMISPLWGRYPGSAEIDDNTYFDFSEAISLFTIMQFL